MDTVIHAGVDDFLDDVVGALEETIIMPRRSAEPDPTGQTFCAEELGDRVSVGGGTAPVRRWVLRVCWGHDLWPPAAVHLCRGVTVDIGVLDRGDRTPEIEVVLRVPASDEGVACRDVLLREEGRSLGDIEGEMLILRQPPQISSNL